MRLAYSYRVAEPDLGHGVAHQNCPPDEEKSTPESHHYGSPDEDNSIPEAHHHDPPDDEKSTRGTDHKESNR